MAASSASSASRLPCRARSTSSLSSPGDVAAADFIQRKPVEEAKEWTGTALRRRFADSPPEEEEVAEPKGLFGRLLARARPLQQAA